MSTKIEIEIPPAGGCSITIRSGDRYRDHLDWGEALAVIAAILVNGGSKIAPYLRTKEQHEEFERQMRGPQAPEYAPHQKYLPWPSLDIRA